MLTENSVKKIAYRTIGMVLNCILKLAPNSYSYSQRRKAFDIPLVGWGKNGWVLKETTSAVSGIKHRYYFHPGIKANSPVFLFLHGLFIDGRNFINISELSDSWTLIAYDFPETSSAYHGDMNDFKYLLDDFLDCLNIDTIYLCGVSFSGAVSIRYAASNPGRVAALLLISTFVMNADSSDRMRSHEMSRLFLRHSDNKLYWFLEIAFKIVFSGKHNPMQYVMDILYVKQIDWYRQAIKSLLTFNGAEESKQIKCQVYALHGSKDKAISIKKARLIPTFISHAQFEIVHKGTHAMMYLQGSEIVAKIRNFNILR